MPEQNRSGSRNDGRELGTSFEQSNSPTFSGDLGPSFEETNKGRKDSPHRFWYWTGGVLLLLIVIFLIHHFSGDTTGTAAAKPAGGAGAGAGAGGGRRGAGGPAAITVDQTKTGNMPVYVQALGTVTPTYTVTMYSQVTGRVLAVHYKEGQMVKKGQPLVDIDPQPYEATLEQALGSLKHDEAVLAEAQMDVKRYQDALAKNAIARQQLEDQEKVVVQNEGTVEADKGAVKADQVQLAYCHIVAPITGRVGLRLVDPGNTVFSGSSSTLVVITAVQPITVVFNVSEDDLPAVQEQLHGKAVLKVDAFDRANATILDSGKLTSLDNQIDTTTGTVKFRASFPNKTMQLFPNQFVNARLLLKTLNGVTLVPNAAVQHNGTQAFAYVVKDDGKGGKIVALQNVATATSDDNFTAVTGLPGGTPVATSGFDRLEAGAKVIPQVPGQHGKHGGAAGPGDATVSSTGAGGSSSSGGTSLSRSGPGGSSSGSSNGSGAPSK